MRWLPYYGHMFRKALAVVVLLLMVSAAVAATTYRWQENRYQKLLMEQQADCDQQISALDTQVQSCSDGGASSGSGQFLSGECPVFNADAPDAITDYRNESRDIAVQLPYNAHWGFGASIPDGYQELSGIDGILFGRPALVEQCRWAHTAQLTFLPPRSPEEIGADVAERMGVVDGAVPFDTLITQVPLSGHTYYSYDLPGFCLMKNFELIGEQYNYIFSACAEYAEDLLPALVSVELF